MTTSDTTSAGTARPAPPSPNGQAAPPVVGTLKEMVPLPAESARGQRRRMRLEWVVRITMPFVVLILWQLTSSFGILDARYFPGPLDIWSTGVDLIRDGRLWEATWVTSKRIFWGFILGASVGAVIGFALGASRFMRAAFEPVMYGMWTIPKLAVLPLLFLIFGFGDMPIIMLVVLNTSFLVIIPLMSAIAGVPLEYRETARSFGVNRLQMFTKVMLPSALPDLFVALKIAAGASVLVVVAAEFVNGAAGLGYLIWNSWQVFFPKPMYVGIVVVAVLGAAFTLLIGSIGRRLAPWSDKI